MIYYHQQPDNIMTNTDNKSLYADKHLILVATYHVKAAVVLSVNNLLETIKRRPDVSLVIIDSASKDGIRDYLKTIHQERVIVEYKDYNIGKPHAVNEFLANNINENNLPKTIWSIDPDVLFDQLSFDYLAEALENLEGIGMLGMRYANNGFNPERNLFFPPKTLKGKNGKHYSLVFPFMNNVAGPIFAVQGNLLKDPLSFRFYPIKFKTPYGPDDAALHDFLRFRGYKNGYLNGTLAKHLKTNDLYAEEIINFKETN